MVIPRTLSSLRKFRWFNPYTLKISSVNFPNCLTYNSFDVSWENLVLDQLKNRK